MRAVSRLSAVSPWHRPLSRPLALTNSHHNHGHHAQQQRRHLTLPSAPAPAPRPTPSPPAPLDPCQGRAWNATPHWCALCREPINAWNDHRGKRDHICLEMFFTALVHCERRWDPVEVWAEVDADGPSGFCLSGGRVSRPPPSAATAPSPWRSQKEREEGRYPPGMTPADHWYRPTPAGAAAAALCGGIPCTSEMGERIDTTAASRHHNRSNGRYENPVVSLQRAHDDAEALVRRGELLQLLGFLMREKVLVLTPGNLHHASFEGSLVLFSELFHPLSGMFPLADAKEVSALTQMVAATYNSETVFDLCRLEAIVPESIARSREVLVSGSNSGVGGGADDEMTLDSEALGPDEAGAAVASAALALSGSGAGPSVPSTANGHGSGNGLHTKSLPFFFKGVFCRAILGALRWSLEPDSVLPPPGLSGGGVGGCPRRRPAARRHRRRGVDGVVNSPSSSSSSLLLLPPPRDREYYAVLAAHACRLLIAEAIHQRVGEYVARVEGVFRQPAVGLAEARDVRFASCSVHDAAAAGGGGASPSGGRVVAATVVDSGGSPRPPAPRPVPKAQARLLGARGRAHLLGKPEVVPPAFNWGMLQYCGNGRFFDGNFAPKAPAGATSSSSRW